MDGFELLFEHGLLNSQVVPVCFPLILPVCLLFFSLDGKNEFTQMDAPFTLTTVRPLSVFSVFVFGHMCNPYLPFSLCHPGH